MSEHLGWVGGGVLTRAVCVRAYNMQHITCSTSHLEHQR